MKKCSKILGIKKVFQLGLPNQELDNIPLIKISQAIEKVIAEVKPERVFLNHDKDTNQDHKALYEAGIIATRANAQSFIKEVILYETHSSTESNLTEGACFEPNLFIDITDEIEKKIEAFSCYTTEVRKWPHPRSAEGIRTLAKYRGMQAGFLFAEAFRILYKR